MAAWQAESRRPSVSGVGERHEQCLAHQIPESGRATIASPAAPGLEVQPDDEKVDLTQSPDVELPKDDDVFYPEGGLSAWLVVLGSFSGMFVGFGIMNSIGTFQAYLSTHQLADYSDGTISWIFSIYAFLAFFSGVQIGPIFDAKGPRVLVITGSVMLILDAFLLGVCTKYWHFVLVFGVIGGIGCSLIFTPAIASIGHWFKVKRGNATGIGATGGAIGGVVFPLSLQALFPRVGFAWATRIMGFIIMIMLGIAILLMRSRLPPKPGGSVWPDFRIFRDKAFAITTLGVFFLEWAFFIPVTYLIPYALASGAFTTTFSYQIIAIYNASSAFGRWAPGYAADKIGRFNTMILALLCCTITATALWLPVAVMTSNDPHSDHTSIQGITITFAILMGFSSGSNISLTPVCVGELCDTEEYGRYYATCYTLVSFGTLTGLPIAGALLSACDDQYWGLVVFTSLSFLACFLSFMTVRIMKVGWKLSAKY